MIPDKQPDLFKGPAKPSQILMIEDVKQWVDERFAIMTLDGGLDEAEAGILSKGLAVKHFRAGGFGI